MTDEKKAYVTMDVVALERLIPQHAYVGDLTLVENLSNYIEWLKAEVDHWKGASKEHAEAHDELRAEVERLRNLVAQLRGALHGQSAVAFAVEHVAKGKVAGADALRTVAERQREACYQQGRKLLTGELTGLSITSARDAMAMKLLLDAVAGAPLVTEPPTEEKQPAILSALRIQEKP